MAGRRDQDRHRECRFRTFFSERSSAQICVLTGCVSVKRDQLVHREAGGIVAQRLRLGHGRARKWRSGGRKAAPAGPAKSLHRTDPGRRPFRGVTRSASVKTPWARAHVWPVCWKQYPCSRMVQVVTAASCSPQCEASDGLRRVSVGGRHGAAVRGVLYPSARPSASVNSPSSIESAIGRRFRQAIRPSLQRHCERMGEK